MKTASPEMLALAPKDFPEKMGPFYMAVSDASNKSVSNSTHLDGECGPLSRDWGCLSVGSRHLAGCVVHSGHEASLRSVLCSLSQDTSGPDRGRLEELRHHLEWG